MCVIAVMFSISCTLLINWLAGVSMCVQAGKVMSGAATLCTCETPVNLVELGCGSMLRKSLRGPSSEGKAEVRGERGRMRRIVRKGWRIILLKEVVCLQHSLTPS